MRECLLVNFTISVLTNVYSTTSQESGSSCADGSVFCLQDLLNNIETDLNVTLSIDYLGQLLQQLPTADSGDILDILNELPTSTVCTGRHTHHLFD